MTEASTALLIATLRDALLGRPVDVGFLHLGKLMNAISGMRGDPHARIRVFEGCVRECVANDPALRERFIAMMKDMKP